MDEIEIKVYRDESRKWVATLVIGDGFRLRPGPRSLSAVGAIRSLCDLLAETQIDSLTAKRPGPEEAP